MKELGKGKIMLKTPGNGATKNVSPKITGCNFRSCRITKLQNHKKCFNPTCVHKFGSSNGARSAAPSGIYQSPTSAASFVCLVWLFTHCLTRYPHASPPYGLEAFHASFATRKSLPATRSYRSRFPGITGWSPIPTETS